MKTKTQAKMFTSNPTEIQQTILNTINKIEQIVGSTFGPGGRVVAIESELHGIPNTVTKDGITVFKALGAQNAYEHLLIEQIRDGAAKTNLDAGDGTTVSTLLSAAFIKNIFRFCAENPKMSPQKIIRELKQHINTIIKYFQDNAVKIDNDNKELLEKVARVSANGDVEMAKAVIEAFELVGYGDSSHVTIEELSGPHGYQVELIEGFPIPIGYEESIGKFHPAFINDRGHQKCTLDKPLFLLFDGKIMDIVQIQDILHNIGQEWVSGNSDFKNVVIWAHGYSENVLNNLTLNFANPNTINVVPMKTPMNQIINSQLAFLQDISAFTGATIFDISNPPSNALPDDLGQNMELFESYRFRTTIVGDPDEADIELRLEELEEQVNQSESKIESIILEERIGKLTNGIAKFKCFGSSTAELKEKKDRAEDAICSVRSAIAHGCLPGGCRMWLNAMNLFVKSKDIIIKEVLMPSLYSPFFKLLNNAGYNNEEIEATHKTLLKNTDLVFDLENCKEGTIEEIGIYDSALALVESLKNAISIASVMGTLGGIIAAPRDKNLEIEDFHADQDFRRNVEHAPYIKNEANERG